MRRLFILILLFLLTFLSRPAFGTTYYLNASGTGDGLSRSSLMSVRHWLDSHASPDDEGLFQPDDYTTITSGVFHITTTRVGTSWSHPITLKADPATCTPPSADWYTRTTDLEAADPAKHPVFNRIQFDCNKSGSNYNISLPFYIILDGIWATAITHYIDNAELSIRNCVIKNTWTGYSSTAVASTIELYPYYGVGSDMHGITYEDCYICGGGRSFKTWCVIRSGGFTVHHCRVTQCFGSFVGDVGYSYDREDYLEFNDCWFDRYLAEADDQSAANNRVIDEVDPANKRRRFHITVDISETYADFVDFTHGGTAKQGLQACLGCLNHSTLWVTLNADTPWDLVAGSDIPRFYDDGHGSGLALYEDKVKIKRCVFSNLGDSGVIFIYHDHADDGHLGVCDIEITDSLFYGGGNIWSSRLNTYDKIGNNFTFKGNTLVGVYWSSDDSGRPYAHYGRLIQFGTGTGADTSTWNISNNLFVGMVNGSVGSAVRCNNILYSHSITFPPYTWPNEFQSAGGSTNQGNIVIYNGETWGNEPHPFDKAGTYFLASASNFDSVFTSWPFNYNLNADFGLKAGSPAIDAGSTTYKTTTDIIGTARGSPPDVGAYEYGSAGSNPPTEATSPSPADDAVSVSKTTSLSWTTGANSPTHHVFFGTVLQDVTDGTGGTDKGTQTIPYSPGTLADITTYYWRIQEENVDGHVDGAVWSFQTANPPIPVYYLIGGTY